MLRQLPPVNDPDILVGNNTADDAAVYRLSDDLALVQTLDYFTPVVDDPYTFGQIAAANALSDVYAMGARPVLALNIVGFPSKTLPLSVLADILRGGSEKAAEAGVSVAGGHTIDDTEPKYGMAVTGLARPGEIVTNAGGQAGDALILTKPLGLGIITTALKNDRADEAAGRQAIEVMLQLNRAAAEAMRAVGVHACTDITGFGFLGHLHELAEASGVAAVVQAGLVPVLEPARELAAAGQVPGGTRRNLAYLEPHLAWDLEVDEVSRLVLADAQTSGGLLLAVAPEKADRLLAELASRGVQGALVGGLRPGPAGQIAVLP